MKYAEMLLPEFEQEMAGARNVLERVPDDKWDWRPHPKSNTIGWNANHLADIPAWVEGTFSTTSYDVENYKAPALSNRREVLELFDRNVAAARKALAAVKDGEIGVQWSLRQAGQPILTLPRFMVIRNFVINHLVHHRAVLCVYLRLNNIPVPGLYGPSGDEQ